MTALDVALPSGEVRVTTAWEEPAAAPSPGSLRSPAKMATPQKEDAVGRFMTGKTDLCCISLRAASGLNLQRATCVVFGELDWSPAVHSQAEDRAHRIGQKDSLLCYYLVSPRGSDRDIQEALGLKVSQFLSLMGDKPETEEQRLMDASIARRHVEKLAMRLGAERDDETAF